MHAVAVALASGAILIGGAVSCSSAQTNEGAPPSPRSVPATVPAHPVPIGSNQVWLSYHADQARTGAVSGPSTAAVQTTKSWSADLGGVVHGQPVAADGR